MSGRNVPLLALLTLLRQCLRRLRAAKIFSCRSDLWSCQVRDWVLAPGGYRPSRDGHLPFALRGP